MIHTGMYIQRWSDQLTCVYVFRHCIKFVIRFSGLHGYTAGFLPFVRFELTLTLPRQLCLLSYRSTFKMK